MSKPIGISLDELASNFISAARKEVETTESELLKEYIRKYGKLEAVKLLLGNDPISDTDSAPKK